MKDILPYSQTVNNALNGEGPFSPERAGTIPADQLAELCFSGTYTLKQIKKMLNGKGGLTAHLGMNDVTGQPMPSSR